MIPRWPERAGIFAPKVIRKGSRAQKSVKIILAIFVIASTLFFKIFNPDPRLMGLVERESYHYEKIIERICTIQLSHLFREDKNYLFRQGMI